MPHESTQDASSTHDAPHDQTHWRWHQAGAIVVPVVDLRAARSPDPAQRRALAATLDVLCRDVGYFYVEHHGVADEVLMRAQVAIEGFFNLPLDAKLDIHISKSPHHRGYVPCGEENALGNDVADFKEVFDIARELPLDHPEVVAGTFFHGPNAWPKDMPSFQPAIQELYDQWLEMCERIAALFAIAFGEDETFFVDKTDEHLCQMRIAKYPPQPPSAAPGQFGCGEHTDYGLVSVLWQTDRPGLQILQRNGQWLDAPCVPGAFTCILGDMAARWTNDTWAATRHRVLNGTPDCRHSSAFFFDPNFDCMVEPLPAFVSDARPPRYAATTMGAHMARGFDGSFKYRAPADAELSTNSVDRVVP